MTAGNAKYASDQWLEKSTRNPQRLTPAFRQRDRLDWVCAVKRRRFPMGANPIRQSLQPEATEQSWR